MDEAPHTPAGNRAALLALDRLKALVDGVLAVVITLLVLDFEAPDTPLVADETAKFLWSFEAQLHPYMASFGLIAAYWIQHTVILAYVRHGNRVFVWLNILFLLPLSLIPFLTSLRTGHPTEFVAAAFFGIGQVLCGVLLLAIWLYATTGSRFVSHKLDPAVVRSMSVRIALGPLFCIAGAFVSVMHPRIGTLIFLCVPALYMSHRKVDASWRESAGED